MSMERTKQTNEFLHSLKELEINLKNTNIRAILEKKEFNVITLLHAIKILSANVNLISDDLLLKLHQKTKELIQHTNYADFTPYFNVFLNPANYLTEYADEILHSNNQSEDSNNNALENNLVLISEEEFSNRYDQLISKLSIHPAPTNLILETPSEKRPFKVYKNNSNTIVVYSGQEATPMSLTKKSLIDHVYNNMPHRLVYARVIADKIIDNTIFEYLSDKNSTSDLTEALKNQIKEQENELFILRKKFDTFTKESDQFNSTKDQLLQLLSSAKNAQKDYENAKESAVQDTQLKTAVVYWLQKQTKHRRQFWFFGISSIVLIFLLIFALYLIINNADVLQVTDQTKTTIEINASTNDTNHSQLVQSVQTDKQQPENNQSIAKNIMDDLPDSVANNYLHHFGFYALLIFASSSILWIIRIAVKIALSNLHLSEDAHERVVMIRTFLSFIRKSHINEEDKKLIISSLFRPSNIGIIQDESSITVADIISSLKK